MRLVALSVLVCSLLPGCSAGERPTAPAADEAQPASNGQDRVPDAATAAARAALEKEPKILEVVLDPETAVSWTIGVEDDGTRRTGYAEYVCIVLMEHGAVVEATTVRIVDHARVIANGGDFRKASLGHVHCSTGRNLEM